MFVFVQEQKDVYPDLVYQSKATKSKEDNRKPMITMLENMQVTLHNYIAKPTKEEPPMDKIESWFILEEFKKIYSSGDIHIPHVTKVDKLVDVVHVDFI